MGDGQKERTLDEIENELHDLEELRPEIWFKEGELYTKAKEMLGHGKFEKWFEKCKFSICKATRCIRMNYYKDMLRRRDFSRTVNLAKLRARMKGDASGFRDLIDLDKAPNFKDPESRGRLQRFIDNELDENDPLLKELFDKEEEWERFGEIQSGVRNVFKSMENSLVSGVNFVQDRENLPVKPSDQKQVLEMVENAMKIIVAAKQRIDSKSVEPKPLKPIDD